MKPAADEHPGSTRHRPTPSATPAKTAWLRRPVALVLCLALLAPPAIAFWYVHTFGVNVLWMDEWDVVTDLSGKVASGTLGLSHLWSLHNEHRPFVPRLVLLLVGPMTRYNPVAMMYVTQFSLVAALAAVVYALWRQFGPKALPLAVPVSLLLFSLRQHENMLWGFQIGFVFSAVFPTISFLLLSLLGRRKRTWKFSGALVCAGIGAFSSAQGLLVWPVGILQLLVAPLGRRLKVLLVAAWTAAGAAAWIVYFLGYVKPAAHPALSVSPAFFLAALGGSLFSTLPMMITAAAILVILLAGAVFLAVREKSVGRNSFWLAIVVFFFLVLGSIMAGRAGFSVYQALYSRYATFSILAVVGIYGLAAGLAVEQGGRLAVAMLGILVGLILLAVPVAGVEGLDLGREARTNRELSALAFLTCESPPDECLRLYPDASHLREQAATLRKLKLSLFADGELLAAHQPPSAFPPPVPWPAKYAIDGVVGSLQLGSIGVIGWAFNGHTKGPAGAVYVEIDGKLYPTYYGVRRKDVAAGFANPDLEYCGFQACIPISAVGRGKHVISLKILSKDRQGLLTAQEQFEVNLK